MIAAKELFIVEDEAIVALDLESRLNKLGYRVAGHASSGEEAVSRLADVHPDLVLMDIHLQGEMDGIRAAELIRRKQDVPVIYLTAYGDEATISRAKVTEPYGFLVKPFEERELRATVEMALFRHASDLKLRSMERWMATTLRSIADGVISTDNVGRVTFMNPVAERLTAWPLRDAMGKRFEQVFRVSNPSKGEAFHQTVVQRAMSTGTAAMLEGDSVLLSRDGAQIPVEDSAGPLRDQDGGITGAVMVFRDVSDRKRAEKELGESQEKLRQAQKMEAIGRLAGGVAHDFNNLLTVMIGYSEILLNKSGLKGEDEDAIEQIHKAGCRAADLTKQLLAYSRRQVLNPRPIDLNEVIQGMQGLLRRLVSEDVVLEYSPSPNISQVYADPSQVSQILMNLVANARDAMPKGGSVRVTTSEARLDDAIARSYELSPGSYVMLSVSDTGVGMSDEIKARTFEPFFTTKPVGEGTGLGLATVYGIVKQSKGHILVESEVDKGATFRILLPSIEKAHVSPASFAPSCDMPPGQERILLVDDNDIVRRYLLSVLKGLGYAVLEAAGAEEALRLARDESTGIDLVLSDIVMPGTTGPDLVNELIRIRPSIKVIFMSGYSDEAVARYGVLEPGAVLLNKPFTVGELASKVRRALESASAAQE
jgi:two-component system, cell cycle sensor histidine kinase and response regulator CckA